MQTLPFKRAICVHGAGGHPCIHWFPWLRDRLEQFEVSVIVPWFPTPEGQHLDTWLSVFDSEVGALESTDILIGHSVGACFLLHVLERSQCQVHAAHLVSAFHTALPDAEINSLVRSFVYEPFNWQRIKENTRQLALYHGENDPYVPLTIAEELAQHLTIPLVRFKSGGHLNTESGHTEFDALLQALIASEVTN